jgi:hypothetical protein
MHDIKEISGFQRFLLPSGKPTSIMGNQSQGVKPRENGDSDRFPEGYKHEDILELSLLFINPRYHAMQEEAMEKILEPLEKSTPFHVPVPSFFYFMARITQ